MGGVIAAYPFGDTKTVKVLTKSPKDLTKKKIEFAFRKRKDIKLTSFTNESEGADDANN